MTLGRTPFQDLSLIILSNIGRKCTGHEWAKICLGIIYNVLFQDSLNNPYTKNVVLF